MARCARSDCQTWRPDVLARTARTGFRLNEAWYCCAACLEREARDRLTDQKITSGHEQPRPNTPRLGALLIHQRVITTAGLVEALAAQQSTGLRLGQQLQSMGLVTSLQVLRALAIQAGVRSLSGFDPTRLHHAPGDLSPEVVRALGVVPIQVDRAAQAAHVACTAPLSRPALRALRELTGWAIEPFLVADDLWPALVEAYGASRGPSAHTGSALHDLKEATARVARAAESGGVLRMMQARCDPYLWVRLEGLRHHEDLLLPILACMEGQPWQAAPTSL
jgi:hypothetical protein